MPCLASDDTTSRRISLIVVISVSSRSVISLLIGEKALGVIPPLLEVNHQRINLPVGMLWLIAFDVRCLMTQCCLDARRSCGWIWDFKRDEQEEGSDGLCDRHQRYGQTWRHLQDRYATFMLFKWYTLMNKVSKRGYLQQCCRIIILGS